MSSSALPAAGRPLSILVVNPDVPPPDRDAGSLRLLRLLELLAADGHRLTLVARAGFDQWPAVRTLEALGVEVHPVDAERSTVRTDVPPLDLEALVARVRPDVAWLSFYETAEIYLPLLRRWAPAARVVVDTVDVHSVREARAAQLSGAAQDAVRAEQTRVREAAIYGAADALVAVSEDDAAALHALAPEVPVAVIGTVHPAAPDGPPRAARDGVLFVGNFRHTPNVDAALHLVRDVWPLVRAARPGAKVTLVGTAPPPAVQALAAPDVEVAGWVPSVEPYLDAAAVSVAPLRFGAGVKGKVGEAMAHGLPVVTTPIGAEGLDLTDGEHALVADSAEGLADAIVALLDDEALWTRLARAGKAALDERLSPERALRGLRTLLAERAPVTFLGAGPAALDGYLGAFGPDDAVSLAVPLAEGASSETLYAELLGRIAALGHDPEAIPDVAVHLWPAEATLPSTAVEIAADAPPEAWRAHLRHEPAAAAARAAVIVRDAAAVPELPGDVDLVVCAIDGQPLPDGLPARARVVRHAPGAGRRAMLARAVHAIAAPVVVAVEPHVLPEPGFAEPLIDAINNGAELAGPVLDGAHGLRIGPDGTLWPLRDAAHAPEALPLDVLAATRATFLAMPAALPSREGHAETQLAAWARARGPLAVAVGARAARAPAPEASVIICTRDRHDILEDVVELVVAQGAAELLIVDNGSTDATPEVAAALAARHPGVVRVVDEPEAGLSRARNTGARAAAHDLLIYLDDDARPAPGWLPAFARELARDGVVSAGGPIVGLWPAERAPGWPAPGLEPLYGVLDHGDGDRTLVAPDIVYGGNWGVRRAALERVGGFDVDLGVGPGTRIGGEEASVAWRLQRAGLGETRYVAAAGVGHLIGAHRLNDRFLATRSLTVGLERPRHLASAGRDELLGHANAAAQRLAAAAPMQGAARLEDVLEAIVAADAPSAAKTYAADALGELAAAVLLLGEHEVAIGALTLALRPEHLQGMLAPVEVAA